MMYQLIQSFPAQLREALSLAAAITVRPPDREFHQIVVAGMGGSGIGADFVAAFIRQACKIPSLVVKDYELPAYVDDHTLLIASSYSGNTEETLAACEQALDRKARVVAITSGGKLAQLAQSNGWDLAPLPPGQPAPRACLGYSLVAQLSVLVKMGFAAPAILEEVAAAAELLEADQELFHEKAQQIAGFLRDKITVIYSTSPLEPVALRFRQQLAENAKMLAWHHVIPEMNHNELVGWRRDQPGLVAMFLRYSGESPSNKLRMQITREVVSEFASGRMEITGKGESLAEQALFLVHLFDWVSYYLAELQGLDAMEIKIIDYLKEEIARGKR
jgi:glucose/mannose-6-phosphate isomerase